MVGLFQLILRKIMGGPARPTWGLSSPGLLQVSVSVAKRKLEGSTFLVCSVRGGKPAPLEEGCWHQGTWQKGTIPPQGPGWQPQ